MIDPGFKIGLKQEHHNKNTTTVYIINNTIKPTRHYYIIPLLLQKYDIISTLPQCVCVECVCLCIQLPASETAVELHTGMYTSQTTEGTEDLKKHTQCNYLF